MLIPYTNNASEAALRTTLKLLRR